MHKISLLVLFISLGFTNNSLAPNPPTYKELSGRATKCGKNYMEHIKDLDEEEKKQGIADIDKLEGNVIAIKEKHDMDKQDDPTFEKAYKTLDGKSSKKLDKKFARKYRHVDKGKDEHLSTATTRDFIKGAKSVANTTELDKELFERECRLASRLRLPTKSTGHDHKDSVGMHPTKKNTQLYQTPGKNHGTFDRKRADNALSVFEDCLKKPDPKPPLIPKIAATASSFTLDEFYAPPYAKGNTVRAAIPEGEKEEAHKMREGTKKIITTISPELTNKGKKVARNASWKPTNNQDINKVRPVSRERKDK